MSTSTLAAGLDSVRNGFTSTLSWINSKTKNVYNSVGGNDSVFKGLLLAERVVRNNPVLRENVTAARNVLGSVESLQFWNWVTHEAADDKQKSDWLKIAKKCVYTIESHGALFQLFSSRWSSVIGKIRAVAVLTYCGLEFADNAVKFKDGKPEASNASMLQAVSVAGLTLNSSFGLGQGRHQLLFDLLQGIDFGVSLKSAVSSKASVTKVGDTIAQKSSWLANTLLADKRTSFKHVTSLLSKGLQIGEYLKPGLELPFAPFVHASSKVAGLFKGFFAPGKTTEFFNSGAVPKLSLTNNKGKMTAPHLAAQGLAYFGLAGSIIGDGTEFLNSAKQLNLFQLPFLTDEFGKGGLMSRATSYTGWTNILDGLRDVGGISLMAVTATSAYEALTGNSAYRSLSEGSELQHKDDEAKKSYQTQKWLDTGIFFCKTYKVLLSQRVASRWQWGRLAALICDASNASLSIAKVLYKEKEKAAAT